MGEEVIPNLEIVRPLTSDQPLSECWCSGKGATGISVTSKARKSSITSVSAMQARL